MKLQAALVATAALAVPATTQADRHRVGRPHAPTPQHRREYLRLYRQVQRRFGHRAPGCKLIAPHPTCHRAVSDAALAKSIGVLQRFFAPPPVSSPGVAYSTSTTSTSTTAAVTASSTGGSSSGLEACIIQHESGGNPQATNGQYGGIGQWSPTAWAEDGGTRYSSSPTGASYSDQLKVLGGEGTSGMESQQAQFDGC